MTPFPVRFARAATLAISAASLVMLASCVMPTERGAAYRVVFDSLPGLLAGDTVQLQARLVGRDGEAVVAARIEYASSDPTIALVERTGRVVAAGAGLVQIVARAPSFANVAPGELSLRVFGAVEIDSVRPSSVRYGEAINIYGVGLNPAGGAGAVRIDGHEAPLLGYVPAEGSRPNGFGVLSAIVAPPVGVGAGAATGVAILQASVVVANARGGASLVTPLTVEMRDRFEPNDTTPAHLGTLSGRLALQGLAFDHLPAGVPQVPMDWYTFTTTAPGDWTITVRSPESWLRQPSLQLVTGPVSFVRSDRGAGYRINDATNHSVGLEATCRGFASALADPRGFDPANAFFADYFASSAATSWGTGAERRLLARNLPAGTHHVFLGTAQGWNPIPWGPGFAPPNFVGFIGGGSTPQATQGAIRYDLTISPGVQGDLPRDAYEPNDFCTDAPTILTLGSTAFADSVINLTYETEIDWDWFRIRGETTGRLLLTTSSESGRNAPRMRVLFPSPGMTGLVGRMTNVGMTFQGELFSEVDYAPGVPVGVEEYYLVGVPSDGGDYLAGYADRYRLTITWQPGVSAVASPSITDSPFRRFSDVLRAQTRVAPGVTLPPR